VITLQFKSLKAGLDFVVMLLNKNSKARGIHPGASGVPRNV